jgi:hypothetical protein
VMPSELGGAVMEISILAMMMLVVVFRGLRSLCRASLFSHRQTPCRLCCCRCRSQVYLAGGCFLFFLQPNHM